MPLSNEIFFLFFTRGTFMFYDEEKYIDCYYHTGVRFYLELKLMNDGIKKKGKKRKNLFLRMYVDLDQGHLFMCKMQKKTDECLCLLPCCQNKK